METYEDTTLYCFVILNYNTIEDTEKCILSIKKLYSNKHFKIIIVDNASPNGTGSVLQNKYSTSNDITVIISNENGGFANGNNIGYSYCITCLNPDFIIIANSDVEFVQEEFLDVVKEKYNKTNFSLLGPDIINPVDKVHQNPLRISGMSAKDIKKGILLRTLIVASNKRNGVCHFLEKSYRYAKRIFRGENMKKAVNNDLFQKEVSNCVLYGACLVFSPHYINRHKLAFYPETFMYFEEEFLWYMLNNNGEITIYSPDLSVVHRVNGSTNATYSDLRKRLVFKESQAIQSAKKLLRYIKSGCPRTW